MKYTAIPSNEVSPVSLRPTGACETPAHAHAKLDRLGIWLSALCAVHCMIMPVVLIFFPVMTWIRWSRMTDLIALGVAAVFGVGGCLLGRRHHRDATPLVLVLAGLTLNGTGRLAAMHLGPLLSQTLIIAGPLLMAYGMWQDRQLCKCGGHSH
jgi:hypothetical protein